MHVHTTTCSQAAWTLLLEMSQYNASLLDLKFILDSWRKYRYQVSMAMYKWNTVCKLLFPLYGGSATLCANQIYIHVVPEVVDSIGRQDLVLSCIFDDLFIPPKKTLFGKTGSPWQKSKTPVALSTIATWTPLLQKNGCLPPLLTPEFREDAVGKWEEVYSYTCLYIHVHNYALPPLLSSLDEAGIHFTTCLC